MPTQSGSVPNSRVQFPKWNHGQVERMQHHQNFLHVARQAVPEETPSLEPFQLVAAAREEYLRRRQEANQYKLRAEKQMGLRPSTADGERYKCLEDRDASPQPAPQDKLQQQQEYLRQLQQIRQQYHNEIRGMKWQSNAEVQPKPELNMVEPPEPKPASSPREALEPTDIQLALRQVLVQNLKERQELQRKHNDKKGVMFEIKLQEEETQGNEEKAQQQNEEEEDDPLNQTLKFGQELNLLSKATDEATPEEIPEEPGSHEGGDTFVKRKVWSQDAPQTLLNMLSNMEVSSGCSTSSSQCEEAAPQDGTPSPDGRKKWTERPPETLLKALSEAQLTCSTLGTEKSCTENTNEDMERKNNDSDVEVDDERLEPRSDDDDTNFEESEDELREEVRDSMRNLFRPTEETQEDRLPSETGIQ